LAGKNASAIIYIHPVGRQTLTQ